MNKVFDLLTFAESLEGAAEEMETAEEKIIEAGCQIIEDEAKRVIGTYEYGWKPLALSTIQKKGSDEPLLETGEMRESIEHTVTKEDGEVIGYVGSNNDKAVWHELGTSKIPARSFLRNAAIHKEAELKEMAGQASEIAVEAELSGANVELEILEIVKHALHKVALWD